MKQEIKRIAAMLLNKELTVMEASRKLVPLLAELDLYNEEDFVVFIAVYSDDDGFPMNKQQRKLLSKERLERKDKEAEEINAFYEVAAMEAAQKLLNL